MVSEKLPSKMLACQVVKFNEPYVLQEVPVPQTLKPHDVLLKIAVASLCHTDSMVQTGQMVGTKLPIIGSHEGTGTAVTIGSEVQNFKVGDRVLAGIPQNRCGDCEDCKSANTQYCSYRGGGFGIQVDGAFAEYALVDSRNSCRIPDDLGFIPAAPLACAGLTIWRGLKQTGVREGEWVGIVGSGGGLGHLGVGFAKALGFNVVGVDARDEGLALTKEAGADLVLDARLSTENLVKEVHNATIGKGVAAAINVSDATSSAGLACAITAKHGRMIQISQPLEVIIPFRELIFRDIKVSGSLTASVPQTEEMLDFAAKHKIRVKTNPYHGLKEIPKMWDDAHSGKMQGKGVVIIDESQVEQEDRFR